MNLKEKKNIIFDLGNVIIDIDLSITEKEFKKLGFRQEGIFLDKFKQNGIFSLLEEGKVSEQEFLEYLKKLFPDHVTSKDILKAWNALILDYKEERILKLLSLKEKYKLYLLSNTNIIHMNKYAYSVPIVGELSNLFDKIFYSHQMGLSKPDPEIFKTVISEANINPKETLFLDDSPCNVKAANELGITSLLVENPDQWLDWFD